MIDLKFAVEAGYFHNIKQFDDYLGEDLRRFYKNLLNKKPQGKLHDAGIDSRVTAELFQQLLKEYSPKIIDFERNVFKNKISGLSPLAHYFSLVDEGKMFRIKHL